MKKERDETENWKAEWLTIPQFADIQPENLLHKEQEGTTEKRGQQDAEPGCERQQTWENLHVLVRAHFFAGKGQENLRLNITAGRSAQGTGTRISFISISR